VFHDHETVPHASKWLGNYVYFSPVHQATRLQSQPAERLCSTGVSKKPVPMLLCDLETLVKVNLLPECLSPGHLVLGRFQAVLVVWSYYILPQMTMIPSLSVSGQTIASDKSQTVVRMG
jgi:hypothetical protein